MVIAASPANVPVPESDTVCGLVDELSVMTSFPVRVPMAVGVKVIETVQLAPAASVCGANGQFVVCAKSAVTETDVIVSGMD